MKEPKININAKFKTANAISFLTEEKEPVSRGFVFHSTNMMKQVIKTEINMLTELKSSNGLYALNDQFPENNFCEI